VRVVADSHTLVWYLSRPERLTPSALEALSAAEASGQGIGVSALTLIDLWHATRKASQPVTAEEYEAVKQVVTDPSSGVEVLALTAEVAERYEAVPHPQVKDPFDRIIVATAWVSESPLVTADDAIRASGAPIEIVW
jgi:PIN domain nuclease of toxin-antitoxin system